MVSFLDIHAKTKENTVLGVSASSNTLRRRVLSVLFFIYIIITTHEEVLGGFAS